MHEKWNEISKLPLASREMLADIAASRALLRRELTDTEVRRADRLSKQGWLTKRKTKTYGVRYFISEKSWAAIKEMDELGYDLVLLDKDMCGIPL